MVLTAFIIYFALVLFIGFYFYKRSHNMEDYILGGRQMGPYVSAMSAQASDMSSWLLMGLPGAIMLLGLGEIWIGIGLAVGSYLSWLFVAKKLRKHSVVSGNSLTMTEFFSNRFKDNKGTISMIASVIILFFFTIYVASGFKGCGTILTTIFKKRGTGTYYGAGLAGPVEKKVSSFIYNRENDWYGRVERDEFDHHPTDVKGGNIAQTRKVADELSPRVSSDRRTGWGAAQVDSTSKVVIKSLVDEPMRMPDVRGMGLKDALFVLESRGVKVTTTGKGAVQKQSIKAGEPIRRGAQVNLTLK